MTEPRVFLDGAVTLHEGDCLAVLDAMPENSVDACVVDPPYHLVSIVKRFGGKGAAPAQFGKDGAFQRASRGFMSALWDGGDIAFQAETWRKVYRVLKPGAHIAAFAAPKNFDLLYAAIREAGFEVRDSVFNLFSLSDLEHRFLESLTPQQAEALASIIDHKEAFSALAWVFGSGMPKSHSTSKAIDRAAGVEREKIAIGAPVKRMIPGADQNKHGWEKNNGREYQPGIEIPATPEAAEWAGWGSGLKPSIEPLCLARKPLVGTIAENVQRYGVGALNIDACRVGTDGATKRSHQEPYGPEGRADQGGGQAWRTGHAIVPLPLGRWPANITHDGSDDVVAQFPDSDGQNGLVDGQTSGNAVYGRNGMRKRAEPRDDGGSAARFFASFPNGRDGEDSADRRYTDEGATNFAMKTGGRREPVETSRMFYSSKADAVDRIGSGHPTVKPVDLLQYVTRLICPKGGTVLDCFAGTGATGEAAWREGMKAVLIEKDPAYAADIAQRLEHVLSSRLTRKRVHLKRRGKVKSAGPLFGDGAE